MMQSPLAPVTAFQPANETVKKMIRSTLVSRNVTIAGHRTSVRLEPDMWSGLSEICRRERASLHEVCTAVASYKTENTSLTAAIRVFVMAYYRAAATEEGHAKAGHGYGVALGIANASSVARATSTQGTSNVSPMNVSGVSSMQQRQPSSSPFMIGASSMNKTGMR